MIPANAIRATLPGGLWIEGQRHQQALLRPISGRDEAYLSERSGWSNPARFTTALLARCLLRLGPVKPVSEDAAASLTVGDREALLLQLRRLTLGEGIQCVVRCPGRGCGEKMDVDLEVGRLLLPAYSHWPERPEATLHENGCRYKVRFRLPTGADQQAAAALAGTDPQAAAGLLMERCVESVSCQSQDPQGLSPKSLDRGVSRRMQALDPQAELILKLECPECSRSFSVHFDTASFFLKEMESRGRQLYRQVHQLAFYYHWSEREILSMPASKRTRYLQLIAESLSEARIR